MAMRVRHLDGDPKHTAWVRNYLEVNGKQYVIAQSSKLRSKPKPVRISTYTTYLYTAVNLTVSPPLVHLPIAPR
jgi:hypothetical protein